MTRLIWTCCCAGGCCAGVPRNSWLFALSLSAFGAYRVMGLEVGRWSVMFLVMLLLVTGYPFELGSL